MPSRIAFSTLAFPDATLAAAASAGRRWGYSGIELRLIDGELIDPAMPAARRAQVRRTLAAAGLPVVALDSSIRLTGEDPGPELRRFLQLASEFQAPLVRVFGGALDPPPARPDRLRAAARAAWRGTWAMDGGSLMNQGVHYVDLLRWCMGPVAEVTAVCATQAHRVEVEDTALAIVRFGSGAVGTILSSTAAFPGFPQRLEVTGTDGTVIVEDGRIVRRAFGAQAGTGGGAIPEGAAPGAIGGATDPAAIDVASHAAQLADLLAAIEEGREPAVDGQAGRDALEIVCAVYESARTGVPVGLSGARES